MRKMLYAALVTLMLAMVIAPARVASESNDEPEPLLCTFEMTFDTSSPDLGWVGTISGAIQGDLKVSERWADNYVVGATEHFFEDMLIATDDGDVMGFDKGVWNFATYKFRAIGWVTGATSDELSYLVGYKIKMMGFTSEFPPVPPSTLVTASGTIMFAPP